MDEPLSVIALMMRRREANTARWPGFEGSFSMDMNRRTRCLPPPSDTNLPMLSTSTVLCSTCTRR